MWNQNTASKTYTDVKYEGESSYTLYMTASISSRSEPTPAEHEIAQTINKSQPDPVKPNVERKIAVSSA